MLRQDDALSAAWLVSHAWPPLKEPLVWDRDRTGRSQAALSVPDGTQTAASIVLVLFCEAFKRLDLLTEPLAMGSHKHLPGTGSIALMAHCWKQYLVFSI